MKILTLTCRNCGVAQWGLLESEQIALQCRCRQFNTHGETREVTGLCWICGHAFDDHDWTGDLAICIKGKAKR